MEIGIILAESGRRFLEHSEHSGLIERRRDDRRQRGEALRESGKSVLEPSERLLFKFHAVS
jgi:hypothetical protein